mmetsp:Transcript_11516/g.20713  ORF Transcript_11516/g.20713 Transcript_11516/m.20713 type:complete len:104 (+) Transcript_11516:265-576(+)
MDTRLRTTVQNFSAIFIEINTSIYAFNDNDVTIRQYLQQPPNPQSHIYTNAYAHPKKHKATTNNQSQTPSLNSFPQTSLGFLYVPASQSNHMNKCPKLYLKNL